MSQQSNLHIKDAHGHHELLVTAGEHYIDVQCEPQVSKGAWEQFKR